MGSCEEEFDAGAMLREVRDLGFVLGFVLCSVGGWNSGRPMLIADGYKGLG